MSPTETRLQTAYRAWARAKNDSDRDLALRELEAAGQRIIDAACQSFRRHNDLADLHQLARIAIWRALPAYNPELSGLSSFLTLAIKRWMGTHVRKNNALIHMPESVWKSGEPRLALVELVDDAGDDCVGNTMPPAPDDTENDVIRLLMSVETVPQILGLLTERQRRVIELKYVNADDMSYTEICAITGLQEKALDNCLTGALYKLRKQLSWSDYLEMSGGLP